MIGAQGVPQRLWCLGQFFSFKWVHLFYIFNFFHYKIHQGHWRKGPSFVDKYNGWFHKCLCFRTQQQSSKHSVLYLVIHSLSFPDALFWLERFWYVAAYMPLVGLMSRQLAVSVLPFSQKLIKLLHRVLAGPWKTKDSLPSNLISLTSVEDSSQRQHTRVIDSLFQDKWPLPKWPHLGLSEWKGCWEVQAL